MIQRYSSPQYQERHSHWVKLTTIVFIGRQTFVFAIEVMGSTMTNLELCWLRLRGRAWDYHVPAVSSLYRLFGLGGSGSNSQFQQGNRLRQD